MQISFSVIGRSHKIQQRLFLLTAFLSLTGYLVIRYWFPLAPNYLKLPMLDVRAFTPSLAAGMRYVILFVLLYGLYLFAYFLVRQMRVRPKIWTIFGTAVLFGFFLLQTYPINSTDVFRYLLHGRVTSIYGENTYTTPPGAFPEDPFVSLSGEWRDESSPYGPVWELFMALTANLFPNDFYSGLITVKLLGLTAFLATGLVLWLLLNNRSPGIQAGFTILWAWNPALLFIFVMDAHNDALMIFWLVLGVYVLKRGYPASGFLIMVLAALTKPVAILSLPLFFIYCWQNFENWRTRIRFLLITAGGTLLLIALTFYPFGSPLDLSWRLLRESSNYPGFSAATVALLAMHHRGIQIMPAHLDLFATIGRLFLVGLMGWLLWRTWHGRSPLRGTADIFIGYLVQALSFRIWYAAWPFPWLLLDESSQKHNGRLSYRLRFGLCFLLTTQLSVIIYGHLHAYHFNFQNYQTHLIGVPFTFLLPLLLAAIPELYTSLKTKIKP